MVTVGIEVDAAGAEARAEPLLALTDSALAPGTPAVGVTTPAVLGVAARIDARAVAHDLERRALADAKRTGLPTMTDIIASAAMRVARHHIDADTTA